MESSSQEHEQVISEIERDIARLQSFTGLQFCRSAERKVVGGCYKALAFIFQSAKSQFFISPDLVHERISTENGKYYKNLCSKLSVFIEEFHVSVEELRKLIETNEILYD